MPKCILSYERSCFAVERRSNVPPLPCGARIGEVPQAEGFGKNQRHCFGKFAENNPCGLCRHPYPRMEARTPPIASQTEGDIAVFQVFS